MSWIRFHVPPKKVRLYDRAHACDNNGYAVPNFREFSPPRIKHLREKSYERYKKTEDGKHLDSIRLTGEVGRIESIRFIEIGGKV
jgi:hypothetical protein